VRTIPADLAAHFAGGVTTLCRCWRIERREGAVLGVTDHDRGLVFGGVAFVPGLEAAETVARLGFDPRAGALGGALGAGGISEAELRRDAFDGAHVETWLVNWAAPEMRMRIGLARIGAATISDGAFRLDLVSRAAELDAVRGRAFGRDCDAELGDARCGVTLDGPELVAEGLVTGGDGRRRLVVEGLGAYAADWFGRGRLTWSDGPLAGGTAAVDQHASGPGGTVLTLRAAAREPVPDGTGFTVAAGCDKRFATCRAKFGNTVNFRGFPHMPGNDFLQSRPGSATGGVDGSPLFP